MQIDPDIGAVAQRQEPYKVPEILFYPSLGFDPIKEETKQDETSLAVAHAKLELDCVTEKDAGYYECVASQGKTSTKTVGVEVRVASSSIGGSCPPVAALSMTTTPPVISMFYGKSQVHNIQQIKTEITQAVMIV